MKKYFLLILSMLLYTSVVRAAPCPAGEYSATGNTPCIPCELGKFQPATGATSCFNCPPGSYQSFTGATTCVACNANQFQDSAGATTCINCPMGKSSNAGANVCVNSVGGSVCGGGTYEDGMPCGNCPEGTFSAGNTGHCTVCPAGQFLSTAGNSVCQSCTAGSSTNNAIGMTECIGCAAGSYTSSEGTAACSPCVAGTYADVISSTACTACAANTFAESAGATTCEACAEGESSSVGAIACVQNATTDNPTNPDDEPVPAPEESNGCGGCVIKGKHGANAWNHNADLWGSLMLVGIVLIAVQRRRNPS